MILKKVLRKLAGNWSMGMFSDRQTIAEYLQLSLDLVVTYNKPEMVIDVFFIILFCYETKPEPGFKLNFLSVRHLKLGCTGQVIHDQMDKVLLVDHVKEICRLLIVPSRRLSCRATK